MQKLPAVLTIAVIEAAYRDGWLTPSVLLEEVLRRIHAHCPPEVWICLADTAALRARANELDGLLRERGASVLADYPLFGMPYAVKDNIDVAGLPTTAACPEFAYAPSASAAAVNRLDAAGALMLGKTNLDQFATGLTGTRSPYGAVPNPFDSRYISGGSSSGSAVAVALGCLPFALGTDTAGSGRVPAGYCNLVGIKPTPGLVSTRGVFPACRSLDCVSIFAHTVEDGWSVLRQLAGYDPTAPYSRCVTELAPCTREIRVGVPEALDFCGDGLAETAFAAALAEVGQHSGARFLPVDFTLFAETAALLYDGPWVAERRAALGDFFAKHAEALEPSVRQVIAKAEGLTACDAFRGSYQLEALRAGAMELFSGVDVLVVPTAPTHYTRAAIADAPIERNNHLGRYTNFVNLLGLCALALPGPFRSDGLPAGITLIAPGGGDRRLAEFARTLEPKLHLRLGLSSEIPPRRAAAILPLPCSEATTRVAVVGAHLEGQPLNGQLVERGARLLQIARTAHRYRLYALPGTTPPKPGLVQVESEGGSIEVEIWELPLRNYGSFVAAIPPPLGVGTLVLEDGARVQGFLCESWALAGALDITASGGWRAYLAELGDAVDR